MSWYDSLDKTRFIKRPKHLKEVMRHKMYLLYICNDSDNKGSPIIKYLKK